MVKVGVKYCGGCNNQYDRSAFLEKIKEAFPEVKFVYVKEDEIYDDVLFLQGCEKSCAYRGYQSRKGFYDVKPSTLEKSIEQIKKMLNNEM